MVIRGPGQPPVARPAAGQGGGAAQAGAQPQATAGDALARLGLFKGVMDPGAAMQKLLGFLVLQGFVPKPDKAQGGGAAADDASKLADALKQMQGKEGLPQTGKLDDKTMKALEKYKPATTPGERATERQAATQMQQQTARMATSYKDQALAAWIKNKAADLPPPASKNLAAQVTPQSLQAQVPQQKPDAATQNPVLPPQQQPELQAQQQQPQVSQQAKTDADPSKMMQDSKATKDAGENRPQVDLKKGQQGKGEDGGSAAEAKKKKGQGDGTTDDSPGGQSQQDEEGLARGDADEQLAFQDGRGNQATGDENEEDERRGAHLMDDGSGEDGSAYKVPPMAMQVREALAAIRVEASDNNNKTTTYKAEFVLYKPGLYARRTMAPQVLNLKVVKATAFDDVWEKAVEQINARLRLFDAEAEPITLGHVQTALQIARVRS